MASSVVRGQILVDVIILLEQNYEAFWDLLNAPNSNKPLKKLRNRIFNILENQVDLWIEAYFNNSNDSLKDSLVSTLLGRTTSQDWKYRDEQIHHGFRGHRHVRLFNDWGLNYAFSATGHPSDDHGVEKWVLDGWKLFSAGLRSLENKKSERQQARNHLYSPTSEAVQPREQISETYFHEHHSRQLSKPKRLSRDQTDPGALRAQQRRDTDAISDQEIETMEQTLKDLGDVLLTHVQNPEIRANLCLDCDVCHNIAKVNHLMLADRFLQRTGDASFATEGRISISSFLQGNYGIHELPRSPRFKSSVETTIRNVEKQLKNILNPKVYQKENRGKRPEPRLTYEPDLFEPERISLCDITNLSVD
ncbi:hypothetical protein JX265_006623 [Neoarthrinium moseri]|uniref:Uncharacterized protein n=1 Tax=Neoarthrinium moseri TaxID=1658444 RepID=A0A9P9WM22_9PEZI|nr:hypothetical protein JX265_006623 [Neoarthrinium moseri]